jgi:hypothetical protein
MVRLGFGIRGALKTAREDKRRAPRRGYTVTAWIRQEDRFGVHECRVLDLSRSGVRHKNGRGQQARVKWRRGTLIGAGFCAP